MTTFLLVHGAWHGGWCWAETEKALREMGHETHAPTLTGLGERSHLAHEGIDADLHVQDILNVIRWRELSDIVLVGHSYGGVVITGVAGQVPDKVRSLIYLDAFVPEQSGVSVFANANPARMAQFEAQIAQGGFTVKPDMFDAWTDDPDKKDWLKQMCTPHPFGCFRGGVTLTGRENSIARKLFIIAARNTPSAFWAEYDRVKDQPGWDTTRIDTMHDAMVERPRELAAVFDGFVG